MQLFSVTEDQCSSQAQKVNGSSSLQHPVGSRLCSELVEGRFD
jgi:hypothetical protein